MSASARVTAFLELSIDDGPFFGESMHHEAMFLAHQLEIRELRKPSLRGAATCGSRVELPTLITIAMR